MKTSVAILAQESLCFPLVELAGLRSTVSFKVAGLRSCLPNACGMAHRWPLAQRSRRRTGRFSTTSTALPTFHTATSPTRRASPHIWVNIGYKGQRQMPYGTWELRVTSAFRSMVEALSRGDDVLGQCVRSKHRTSSSLAAFLALIHQPSGNFLQLRSASCISTRVA